MAKPQNQLTVPYRFTPVAPIKPVCKCCPSCNELISNMDGKEYLERYNSFYCGRYCFFSAEGIDFYPSVRKVRVDGELRDVQETLDEMECVEHGGHNKAS